MSGEEPTKDEQIEELRSLLAISESELALNKAFVEECPMALIAISVVDQKICLWNKYAVRIFGYTEYEALGQGLELIIPTATINKIEHLAKVQSYSQSGAKAKGMGGGREFKALAKNGTMVDVDIKIFPINLGDLVLIGAAAEDVTIMRTTIRELGESNEALEMLRSQLKQRLQDSEHEKVKLIEVNSRAKIENLLVKIYAGGLVGTMSLLVIFGIGPMILNLFQLVPDDMAQTAAIAVQGLLQVIAGQVAGGAGVAIGKSQSNDESTTNTTTQTSRTVYGPADEANSAEFPTTYNSSGGKSDDVGY